MMLPMGRLEKVDLRAAWATEAGDFTPWLAQKENLELLAEVIGLELELEGTERDVGPFRADILCKDTVDGNWVLIENQLERTDHSHLGQLLTYAAGLDAVTIVWIARTFTDEHRAALDWLNASTKEGIDFFGLEIELWRIGDSAIAPKFNVVSKPNEWTKSPATTVTEAKQWQLDYWTHFMAYVSEHGRQIKERTPYASTYADFAIGRSDFVLVAKFHVEAQMLRVMLLTKGPNAGPHFYLLRSERGAIERELGFPLSWEERPNRKQKHIALYRRETDPQNRDDWPRQHKWLLDTLEEFHRVFVPRVRDIDASEYSPEEEATQGDVPV